MAAETTVKKKVSYFTVAVAVTNADQKTSLRHHTQEKRVPLLPRHADYRSCQ